MTNPALSLDSVSKSFPGVKALTNVSFDIEPGQVHCLLGENGAGKSTLIKILAGAQTKDGGSIRIFGEERDFTTPTAAQEAGIGVVYQELSNFGDLDVAHNIFPNRIQVKRGAIDRQALYVAARERLDACGLTAVDPRSQMGDISLGQQQMVEIARLVGEKVKIVILDEPTSALTDAESQILFDLIAQMKAQGITVIYISHRLDEVLELADSITVLKDGTHVTTFEKTPHTTKDDLVRFMVGRDVVYDFRDRSAVFGEPILSLDGVSVSPDVFDVSFELRKGEVLGIAGLEGSGRTELLRALFGMEHITAGTVQINGKPANIKGPIEAKRAGLAYITKDRKHLGLFLGLSVAQNIVAAAQQKGVKHGLLNETAMEVISTEYVDALNIKCSSISQTALNLSGGNQQKVLLSMWLNTDPEIIMIDEPTRGVDVSAKAEIHRLLHEYAAAGNAVLFVSSELTELLASCDRVLVMHEGSLAGCLVNDDNLTEEQIMSLASGV